MRVGAGAARAPVLGWRALRRRRGRVRRGGRVRVRAALRRLRVRPRAAVCALRLPLQRAHAALPAQRVEVSSSKYFCSKRMF